MSLGSNHLRNLAINQVTKLGSGQKFSAGGLANQARGIVRGQINDHIPPALRPLASQGIDALENILFPGSGGGGSGTVQKRTASAGSKVPAAGANTVCGYTYGDTPDQYIITIVSRTHGVVRALIQDEVAFQVSSNWESFIPEGARKNVDLANTVAQALFKTQIMTRFASRRIWKATTPLQLNLKLLFESETDALNDVVEPCKRLQGMCVPGERALGFLIPPGPNPFTAPESLNKHVDTKDFPIIGENERIDVYIGKFISFRNVIVKSVGVTFNSRYEERGYPISANADLNFESYEIVTKRTLIGTDNKPGDVYRSASKQEWAGSDIINPMQGELKREGDE